MLARGSCDTAVIIRWVKKNILTLVRKKSEELVYHGQKISKKSSLCRWGSLAAPATSARGIRLPVRLVVCDRRGRPPAGRARLVITTQSSTKVSGKALLGARRALAFSSCSHRRRCDATVATEARRERRPRARAGRRDDRQDRRGLDAVAAQPRRRRYGRSNHANTTRRCTKK